MISLFGKKRHKTAEGRQMFAPVQIKCVEDPDGTITLINRIKLDHRDETLIDALENQAVVNSDRVFLKERSEEGWTGVTYSEFHRRVKERAAQLIATGRVDQTKPLLILAHNSIEHAITAFSAMYIGVPAAPVSPAYGVQPGALSRLEQVVSILEPGAVYLGDAPAFAPALPYLKRVLRDAVYSHLESDGVLALSSVSPASDETLASARAIINSETVAKIIFTSGSTGVPKGVKNSHRMMCSNQRALAHIWPFLLDKPPILVDWLPWSHTFGGNVCLNLGLFTGGTMHIDQGKPTPALFSITVDNLKRVSPSLFLNVPAGIEALLPILEEDTDFARHFFSSLDAVFVAAAALPQKARDRLHAAGLAATGKAPVLIAGWGATETAPFASSVFFETDRSDNIGLPMPGTTIRLTPDQDKLGLSVKGPNVTTGYWNNPAATAEAFDADGFYLMGDAGALIDPKCPEQGLRFDGRLSENFKLLSGTWVNVGMLRVQLVGRLTPLVSDIVITGHNQKDLGALLVVNSQAKGLAGLPDTASLEECFASEDFRSQFVERFRHHNSENPGSSSRIKRFALLSRPPEISRNEITDKGYINQRAMLSNWSELVQAMHCNGPETDAAKFIVRL